MRHHQTQVALIREELLCGRGRWLNGCADGSTLWGGTGGLLDGCLGRSTPGGEEGVNKGRGWMVARKGTHFGRVGASGRCKPMPPSPDHARRGLFLHAKKPYWRQGRRVRVPFCFGGATADAPLLRFTWDTLHRLMQGGVWRRAWSFWRS
eukprot:364586-Chlamydomonas_euryale.AAC.6